MKKQMTNYEMKIRRLAKERTYKSMHLFKRIEALFFWLRNLVPVSKTNTIRVHCILYLSPYSNGCASIHIITRRRSC